MRIRTIQIKFNLHEGWIRIEKALTLQPVIVSWVSQFLSERAGAFQPETPMVSRLFQVFELMRAVVITQNQPKLLTILSRENYSSLWLNDVLENVHIDLPLHILVQSIVIVCAVLPFYQRRNNVLGLPRAFLFSRITRLISHLLCVRILQEFSVGWWFNSSLLLLNIVLLILSIRRHELDLLSCPLAQLLWHLLHNLIRISSNLVIYWLLLLLFLILGRGEVIADNHVLVVIILFGTISLSLYCLFNLLLFQ